MFVGDIAPMSHLQSIRHFLTALSGSDGFPSDLSCDSLLEQPDAQTNLNDGPSVWPIVRAIIDPAIDAFCDATAGMLDVGDSDRLRKQIRAWTAQQHCSDDVFSAVNYLILALGSQPSDEQLANAYYCRARGIVMNRLTFDTNPLTVQALLLTAIYMFRSCQPNGSYIYFGLAARASYSIGMHRTEVNARFGKEAQMQRERL